MALAGRAFNQALKFGAEIAIPLEVARLDCGGAGAAARAIRCACELTDGRAVRARTVVVASGARYRRPDIPNLADLRGRRRLLLGVAGRGEALRGRGGGAGRRRQLGGPGGRVPRAQGQAPAPGRARQRAGGVDVALPDRPHPARCRTSTCTSARRSWRWRATARRPHGRGVPRAGERGHAQLPAAPSVPVHRRRSQCRLAPGPRRGRCQGLRRSPASPARDGASAAGRPALPLETSFPGVFAIGDVRAGSTKRVAAAVGEGAAVVAQIHTALALQSGHA